MPKNTRRDPAISAGILGDTTGLGVAQPPKRARDWDKAHTHEIATFRGIPHDLRVQLKKTADDLGVPVGEIARCFLEYGLKAYRAGDLKLEPRLVIGKKSLYTQDSKA